MVEKLVFDLCKPLEPPSDVPDSDKCPAETFACLTVTNQKPNVDDRVVTVVPLATKAALEPSFERISDDKLSLSLSGPPWPATDSTPSRFNVTLQCAENDDATPTIENDDVGFVQVLWKSKVACATKGDPPPNTELPPDGNDAAKSKGGSGVGWFFFLLLLCFAAYFGLGAYYNYNNYGASGWDLVPHRDFWRDVPHLLRDVVSHLFSSVRGNQRGGSRGGYVSV